MTDHRAPLVSAQPPPREDSAVTQLKATVSRGLRASWLILAITSGIALILLLVLAKAADDVAEGDTMTALDRPIASGIVGLRTVPLTSVMEIISAITEPAVMLVLCLVAAAFIWRKAHDGFGALSLVTAVGLAAGASFVGKATFARTRPPAAWAVNPEASSSFPSAHVAVIVAAVTVLLWWGVPRVPTNWRIGLVAAGVVLCAFVAASRLYLGAHWLTDILAGLLVGLLAAVVGIGVGETLRTARRSAATQSAATAR
ncbi:MAG: phosphatase PAP2 family protein [Candidatus Nanopelagicales bacterium]